MAPPFGSSSDSSADDPESAVWPKYTAADLGTPPVGRNTIVTLPDDRIVPVWVGGDPEGAPVLFHAGTPSGRYQAMQLHEAAYGAGVRLISFNRPGYGRSPLTPAGLASVGLDARTVRGAMGIKRWAVAGLSGGGPYAVATAAAEPEQVSRTLVVAGAGPWMLLNDPDLQDPERPYLEMAARGETEAAWDGLQRVAASYFGDLLEGSDEHLVDTYFEGTPATDLGWLDANARERWAVDARDALATYDGFVRDALSFAGEWDIDLAAVQCPVALVYGDADGVCPPRHGEWYRDQLPTATLKVLEGAGHGTTCFTDWAARFAWLAEAD